MTRRAALFVLFAVLVTACGAPRSETPDFTDDLASVVVAAALVPEIEPGALVPLALPDGIHIQTSLAIERPSDFPSIAQLQGLVADAPHPYPRALITSCLSLAGGGELLSEQGFDTGGLDQRMKITYFDGLVVWEDAAGFRQVFTPDVGSYYQDADGSWQEATGSEWTVFGPLSDWSQAQEEASAILAASPQVVGYETVADTPTVRLLLVEGDDRAHVWIDKTGATLRLVEDFGGPDGESRWIGIWSVETLSPVLAGPMP
jgi:hypothetical protein